MAWLDAPKTRSCICLLEQHAAQDIAPASRSVRRRRDADAPAVLRRRPDSKMTQFQVRPRGEFLKFLLLEFFRNSPKFPLPRAILFFEKPNYQIFFSPPE
jgi:hypothetical protein